MVELTEEQFYIEMQTIIFIDDLLKLVEKYKIPESIIETKFLSNESLPRRVVRSIFTRQPLSKSFLIKHSTLYDFDWIKSNPNYNQEFLDDIKLIHKLTGEDNFENT